MTKLLRVEEAALELGLGRSKVYELIRSGALVAVHIGKAVRVRSDDLDAFVNELPPDGPG